MNNYYLFLDTQVFDANAYDFENKHFKLVAGLVELGVTRLLMPMVTRREIESHIATKSKEAFVALDKFRNSGFHRNLRVSPFDSIAKGTTEEAIHDELLDQFRNFCTKAEVVDLPLENVDLKSLLDDYFERKPPFGEGKKKSEFPDAISAKLLQNWCAKHKSKVTIVSGDTDWGKIKDPNLIFFDSISQYLALFPDPNIALPVRKAVQSSSDISKLIEEEFEAISFYDDEYDAELTEPEVEEISCGEFDVIEAKDGVATLEADVEISFSIRASGQNHTFHFYDDDRQDRFDGTVSAFTTGTVTVEVLYDGDDPSDIDFSRVTLTGISRYVNVSRLYE